MKRSKQRSEMYQFLDSIIRACKEIEEIQPMLLQRQNIATRPLTSAHLAQTMTLLSLNTVELSQKVENALASNPALELAVERHCPICQRVLPPKGSCSLCSRPEHTENIEPIVFISPPQDFYTRGTYLPANEFLDDDPANNESLSEYVLRQIAAELKSADRPLAAHLLTNLDEDGLLTIPIVEVARYHHTLPSRVEAVLRLIQHADPIGVGSSTPKEALLVQLEALSEIQPVPALAERAIREGMKALSRHRYDELAQQLKVSAQKARQIAHFISENLNPFPARAHWGNVRHAGDAGPSTYQTPDAIISLQSKDSNAPLVVEVIAPHPGSLRINPLYRQALQQASPQNTSQMQGDLEQAKLLIKCLQQRNQAIVRLMQRLVILQRNYILQGEAYMQPLTRAQLAKELGVHESTISRAVSGKSVQLPDGHIVPLAKFFDRSLQVRTLLKQLIKQEDKSLSDSELAERLALQGFRIARRTVAKYRAMEGILPAHLRQDTPAV